MKAIFVDHMPGILLVGSPEMLTRRGAAEREEGVAVCARKHASWRQNKRLQKRLTR